MKPIVGIMPLWDEEKDSYWMLPGYINGIAEAGAIPVMLPMTDNPEDADRLLSICSGLLFTGGQDVDPTIYGQAPHEKLGELCPARDRMELVFLKKAIEKDMPVLGICRGLQFINAALGGTLYQDLPTQYDSDIAHSMTKPYDGRAHGVTITEGSPLYDITNASALRVNSIHHQAIRDLAPGLEAMAYSEDGLVEAIRRPGSKFLWAVQWHPEFLHRTDAVSKGIFSAFVDAMK